MIREDVEILEPVPGQFVLRRANGSEIVCPEELVEIARSEKWAREHPLTYVETFDWDRWEAARQKAFPET